MSPAPAAPLCPVDGSPLQAREDDPLSGWACARCRGAWFPYRIAIARLGHVAKPPEPAMPAARLPKCPEDGSPLRATRHRKGPEINVCARCAGVWLDAGELEPLVAQIRPVYVETPTLPDPGLNDPRTFGLRGPVAHDTAGFGEALEGLLYGVAGLVATPAVAKSIGGAGAVGVGILVYLVAGLFISVFGSIALWQLVKTALRHQPGLRASADVLVATAVATVIGAAMYEPKPGSSRDQPSQASATAPAKGPAARPASELFAAIQRARQDPAQVAAVAEILASGTSADAKDHDKNRPLYFAIRDGKAGDGGDAVRLELARLLLDRGARPHFRGPDQRALAYAALGDPPLFGYLVRRGFNANDGHLWHQLKARNPTADQIIAIADQVPVLRNGGWAMGPFCLAVLHKDVTGRGKLIEYFARRGGAHPDFESCQVDTPLFTAVAWYSIPRRLELIDQLLAAGASLNKRNSNGWTLLMRAGHSPEAVRYLIAKGVDVNATSRRKTALDTFEYQGQHESAGILRAAGGVPGAEVPRLREDY